MGCSNVFQAGPKVRLDGVPPWHCSLVAEPDASGREMRVALDQAEALGLEPVPDEEHEAELLEDGRVRIWLRPNDLDADPFGNSVPSVYLAMEAA